MFFPGLKNFVRYHFSQQYTKLLLLGYFLSLSLCPCHPFHKLLLFSGTKQTNSCSSFMFLSLQGLCLFFFQSNDMRKYTFLIIKSNKHKTTPGRHSRRCQYLGKKVHIKKSSISHDFKIQSKSCTLLSDSFSCAALEVLLEKDCRICFSNKRSEIKRFVQLHPCVNDLK